LQNDLWLDPNPAQPSAIPANLIDGLSVLRHELGHGLGITTYRDSSGTLPAGYEMTWDELVQIHSDGTAWFTGANAEAIYGGPVPVTTLQNGEQYAHLGNSVNDADGRDLMNGVQFGFGKSYDISSLDLAILKDLGAPVTTTVTATSMIASASTIAVQNSSSLGSVVARAPLSGGSTPEPQVQADGTSGDSLLTAAGAGFSQRTALLGQYMASAFTSSTIESGGTPTANPSEWGPGPLPHLAQPAANQMHA
jgi:hypothetical protein